MRIKKSSDLPLVPLPRLHSALRHQGQSQVPFHTHDAVEGVLVTHGRIRIRVAGQILEGRPGVFFVLPGQVPHDQGCRGSWRTLCVLFRQEAEAFDSSPRALDLQDAPWVRQWLEQLCDLSAAGSGVSEAVLDRLLSTVLGQLGDMEQQRQTAGALHPRLAQAVRFLRQHVGEDLDAPTLASASYVSYSHLSALFRERFGCGPLKYHQRLRLEMARNLLRHPYQSVAEVARQCGYRDSNYFVRLFRKAHGLPPGKWRKEEVFLEKS